MNYKTQLLLFTLIFSLYAVTSTANSAPSVVSPHLKVSSRYSDNIPFEIKKVSFSSGRLLLHGIIYKPIGSGPFPTILFNHGSSLKTKEASDSLGPIYARHGWVFFMPSRRGQGLSHNVGHYIGNEIENARKKGGDLYAAEIMVQLLKGDHLNDQMAALNWLRKQSYVATNQIAAAGVSFGGIQTILGVEKVQYCAAIDAAGAAQSWSKAHQLQKLMIQSVKNSKTPIFFFQAKNDYNLTPTHILSAEMKKAGKKFQMKIYPSFGRTVQDGHAFGYFGSAVWSKDVFIFLDKYCVGRGNKHNT